MGANGGNIRFGVDFNVNKSGLNQLKTSLQEIQKLTAQDLMKINNSSLDQANGDLKKLKASVLEIDKALDKAFNSDLGTLNVSKFNSELKKMNLNQIYSNFSKAGVAGQNAFRNVTTQILTTNMQLKKTHNLIDEMATTMANTVKWGIASSVMNNFTGSVQKAYGYVKNLDNSLNDIRIVTGYSADEMDRFAVQANKAAKALGKSTTDYTEAALIYYQQGLSDEDVAARAETTLKAANVTGQSGQEVSEQLTAVWNGYKVSAEEAELYIDKLAAVAAKTASNLEELSTGMSKVASAANLMGVDVDQLNAQLSTIISVTRQAPESVGTALKTIYARMGDIEAGLDGEVSLDEYTSKMAEMGVNVLDASGQLRDMGTVIEEIGEKWTSMSREQQLALSQIMAGTRQYNNLLALFDNWDMYTNALETSTNAAGTLQNQQEIYMESIQAHLQQLKAASEDLYDSLLDPDGINPVIDGLTLITDLTSNFIDSIGGGGGVLLGLGSIATKVFSQQIANGIATFIVNMQSAKENANQLRAELEILKHYETANLGNAQVEYLISMKRQILDLDKSITNEERNIANEYINQQNELYKQQDILEARKRAAEETYKRATGENLSLSGKYDAGVIGKDLNERADEIENAYNPESHKQAIESYKQLKQAAQEYIDIANSGLPQTQDAINKLDATAQKYNKTLMNQLKMAQDTANSNEFEVNSKKELITELEKLDKLRGKDGELNLKNINVIKQLEKIEQARIKTYKKEAQVLRETANEVKNFANETYKGAQKADQLTNSWNNFIKQIDLRHKIQQSVQLFSSFGQLASAMTTISQIGSIWSNEDLTTGEKLLQTITNLGFAIPMLVNSIGQVNKVLGLGTSATKAYQAAKLVALGTDKTWIALKDLEISKEIAYKAAVLKTTGTEAEAIAIKKIMQNVSKGKMTTSAAEAAINQLLAKTNVEVGETALFAGGAMQTFLANLGPIVGVFIAIGAISGAIALIDKFTVSSEEAKEALTESVKEYEEAEKELESLESKLKDVNSQLEELYSKDELTLTDKQQIAHLEAETQELKTQIALQEELLALKKQNVINTAKSNLDSGTFDVEGNMFHAARFAKGINVDLANNEEYSQAVKDIEQKAQQAELKGNDGLANWYHEQLGIMAEERSNFIQELNSSFSENKFLLEAALEDPVANEDLIAKLQDWFTIYHTAIGDIDDIAANAFENSGIEDLQGTQETLKSSNLGDDGEWSETDLSQIGLSKDAIENLKTSADAAGFSLTTLINTFIELEHASQNSVEYAVEKLGELTTPKIAEALTPIIEGLSADKVDFSTIIESINSLDLSQIDWSNPQEAITQLANLLKVTALDAQEAKNKIEALADTADIAEKFDLDVEPFEDLIEYLQEEAKEIEDLSEYLEENGNVAQEVAKDLSRYDRALEKVIDNYDNWEKMLSSDNIQDSAEATGELKDVYADLLDLDVSNAFASSIDNLELLKQAANGSEEAYNELLAKAQQEIRTKYELDTSNWDAPFNELMNQYYQGQSLDDLEVGASLNNEGFLQGLTDMVNAAGMSAADATDMLSSMGIDAEVIEDTSNTTETSQVANLIPKPVEMKGMGLNPTTGIPTETTFTGVRYDIDYQTVNTPKQNKAFGLRVISANKSSGGGFKYKNSSHGSGSKGGSSGKGGGGGGGGGSSKPKTEKPLESKKDRYHDVNVQLEQIDEELEDIGRDQEKLFGKDLLNSLNKELKVLEKQRDVLQDKLDIARQEQKELQDTLSAEGVQFNQDGTIANYLSIMQQKEDEINALISQYNAMSAEEQEAFKESTLDPAMEAYEEFVENLENYDDVILETIPEIENAIQDVADREVEINIQKLNMEIELRLDLSEAQKDWDEFKRKVIDDIDDDDTYKNAIADADLYETLLSNGTIEAGTNTLNTTIAEIQRMNNGESSSIYGNDKQAALEDLANQMDGLMGHLEDLVDLQDQIHESYLDMIDKTGEAFDEQVESYEYVGDLLEHNMNLIQLINGEDAYSDLANLYEAQEKNNLATIAAQKSSVDYYRSMMETETDSEALEKWTELWKDAVADLNSTVEASVENIIDKYANSINIIFDELDNKLTNGKGLDYLTQEWELQNENAEMYLDTINSAYEIQSLERKVQDSINNTDSLSAQKKLNDFMDEELKKLREKEKITQYDVDRANALYEIKLKEIALEEAQQNKSKMRLRRDASGNYSYQFVADQDSISAAQQELDDAKNSLYNMDKDKYKENQQAILDAYTEYQEKMRDAANLSAEERALIEEEYNEKINFLLDENEDVRINLMDSAFSEQAALYGSDVANFQQMSADEQQILMDTIVPTWDSGIQAMIEKMTGEGGFGPACRDAMEQLDIETKNYETSLAKIEETAGTSFGALSTGTNENIELAEDLANKMADVVTETQNETIAVGELKTQVDLLAQAYKTVFDNATNALTAAQNLAEYEKKKAAEAAAEEEARRKAEEEAANGGTAVDDSDSGGSSGSGGSGSSSTGETPDNTNLAEGVAASIWLHGSNSSGWGKGAIRAQRFNEKGVAYAQKLLNDAELRGDPTLYKNWIGKQDELKKYYYKAFDTGGYTGEWGDEGKLAVLHEKELVLNKDDTKNILSAMMIARSMESVLSALNDSMLTRTSGMTSGLNSNSSIDTNNSQEIQQHVTIDANFPGVSSRTEIEEAFKNLVNIASQHAFNTQR